MYSIFACVIIDLLIFYLFAGFWNGESNFNFSKFTMLMFPFATFPLIVNLGHDTFNKRNSPSGDIAAGCVLTLFFIGHALFYAGINLLVFFEAMDL